MTVSHRFDRRLVLAGLGAAALTPALARAAGKDCFVFLQGNKVLCADVDGTNLRTIAERPAGAARGLYDGIALDHAKGHVYWTDMGGAAVNDGTITRANLDGTDVKVIIPSGGTFTPKQMKIDLKARKLYWSDREGMRVMRSNMDGSNIEVLVQTGDPVANKGDQARWCVGCAVDTDKGYVYWTQKGGDNQGVGSIRRAPIRLKRGQTAESRTDIETLFSNMPEPIDLDLDLKSRLLYWTDRGDNTVNRAPLDAKGFDPAARKDRQVLVTGMKEAIGVSIDLKNNRLFYTSLGGEVGTATLDGKNHRMLLTGQGTLTGIEVMLA